MSAASFPASSSSSPIRSDSTPSAPVATKDKPDEKSKASSVKVDLVFVKEALSQSKALDSTTAKACITWVNKASRPELRNVLQKTNKAILCLVGYVRAWHVDPCIAAGIRDKVITVEDLREAHSSASVEAKAAFEKLIALYSEQ